MTMTQTYPLELSRQLSEPDFELWQASVADYDKAEKLHPTVYVELVDAARDLLPPPQVRVQFAQDFSGLASPVPERIIVQWAPAGQKPSLPPQWFDRFVRQVIATGHHTIILVAEGDCRPRLGWFVRQVREAVDRRVPAFARERDAGLDKRDTSFPAGGCADPFADWLASDPL